MAKARKLSIIIPCYNEKNTIREILAEVVVVDLGSTKKEIIIVDDGSKIPVADTFKDFHSTYALRWIRQDNQGAGAARRGAARGGTAHGCRPDRGGAG